MCYAFTCIQTIIKIIAKSFCVTYAEKLRANKEITTEN